LEIRRGYRVDGSRFQHRNGKEQDAALLSFLEEHSNSNSNENDDDHSSDQDKELNKATEAATLDELEKKRQELFNEAKAMTLSFYRTCIRCTKDIKHGNIYDEQEFQAREEEQKAKRTDVKKMMSSSSSSISFEPPVDRENELLSRSSYYLAFVKESFGQEVDCLKTIPWSESDVSRFTFLMKNGEERRSWILKTYKFDDPYYDSSRTTLRKLESWDEKATDVVQKIYRINQWSLSSDYASEDMGDMSMEEAMAENWDVGWDDEIDRKTK